jgi:hypothetical protein
MASTISAGTTSGTAIVVSGDTTGNLAFQTNGTTTAMTINTSQNVGIGTTSPSTALQVNGTVTATTFSGAGTSLTGTANSLNAGIGVNQTWQNVFASRAVGTTYTNSTGKSIGVAISYTCNLASTVQGLTINGLSVYASGSEIGNGSGFFLIVPDGNTYAFLTNGGTITIVTWNELR